MKLEGLLGCVEFLIALAKLGGVQCVGSILMVGATSCHSPLLPSRTLLGSLVA